jgi:hypothetical protein
VQQPLFAVPVTKEKKSSLLSSLKELEEQARPQPTRVSLSRIVSESLQEAQVALKRQTEELSRSSVLKST